MARLLQGAIHWMRGERRLSGVKRPLHHIPPHCTLLGCAFLTCKWPPEGFTHCASNLDTGTRPRILFSSTHLCIFVTWVSTVNFSGRYHLANVSYSVVRLRKKKQQQYACLIVSFVLKTMCWLKASRNLVPSAPVCEPAVPSLQKYQISNFHEQFVAHFTRQSDRFGKGQVV